MLIMFVKDNIIHHIANFEDLAQAWKALHDLFDYRNTTQTMLLFNRLHSITVDKRSSVANYLQKINEITTQLRSSRKEASESQLVHITLKSLVQGLMVLDKLRSLEKLIEKLLVEESRGSRRNTTWRSTIFQRPKATFH